MRGTPALALAESAPDAAASPPRDSCGAYSWMRSSAPATAGRIGVWTVGKCVAVGVFGSRRSGFMALCASGPGAGDSLYCIDIGIMGANGCCWSDGVWKGVGQCASGMVACCAAAGCTFGVGAT